ncbi:MAG: response regulator [Desulfobacteraceae bacterium]|nr:MAG: response regulator [Desulfobacteraceae bacterium]
MLFKDINSIINRFSEKLRITPRWPWYLIGIIIFLSEIVTLIMNSINSFIWWGRIDCDLLIIGTIDAFVAAAFIGPIAVFFIRHAFSLEDFNRNLQGQMAERIRSEEERRILEERLQQAKKMEAIGMLAGGVAHDLNNILSGLVGYPDLLLMRLPADSPLREPLLAIKESGQKAAAVVQDLLTLARRGIQTETVLNPNEVIRNYLKSLEFKKLETANPRMVIETRLSPDLLNIRGSAVHLGKALMNLVINACEAVNGSGLVNIVTENVHLDTVLHSHETIPPGDYAMIGVSDSGEGIAPNDLERIFEPFYTKKAMGRSGTGLGLAVVWGTVKDHGGFIDVRSIAGQGARLLVYLPAIHEEIESTGLLPEAADAWKGKGETILVVDDDLQQRVLAQSILSYLGYVVQTVAGGIEAVDYLKKKAADLVVLDMIMDPGIDGLETFQRIQQIHPGQKAIITSGFSETTRVEQAMVLGAGTYLRKPYLVAKLGQAVRKELDKPNPPSGVDVLGRSIPESTERKLAANRCHSASTSGRKDLFY